MIWEIRDKAYLTGSAGLPPVRGVTSNLCIISDHSYVDNWLHHRLLPSSESQGMHPK